jgi:hypothetical protein
MFEEASQFERNMKYILEAGFSINDFNVKLAQTLETI